MNPIVYTMDGESFEFEDVADLEAALDGEYGEDYQLVAEQVSADLEEQAEQELAQAPEDRGSEFAAQAKRAERERGVPLTRRETEALAIDQAGTGPPDVEGAFKRGVIGDIHDDDDYRRQVLADHMQDAGEEQDYANANAEALREAEAVEAAEAGAEVA